MSRRTWRTAPHNHLGNRGSCLLFFGGLDLVYAWSMWSVSSGWQPSTPTYEWFGQIMDLRIWALIWAPIGITCLIFAARTEDRPAFVLAIGIKVVWGLLSIGGWIFGPISLLFGAFWLSLAGLVWKIAGWSEPEDHGEDGL